MATFTIRTINSSVETAITLDEPEDAAAALALGVQGAVAMVADEIAGGAPVSAVQVSVEERGRAVRRAVVTLGVAPIVVPPHDPAESDPAG